MKNSWLNVFIESLPPEVYFFLLSDTFIKLLVWSSLCFPIISLFFLPLFFKYFSVILLLLFLIVTFIGHIKTLD